jgi:mono/diheme cytochrome c family protein
LECGGLPPLYGREQAPALQENRLMRQPSPRWYGQFARFWNKPRQDVWAAAGVYALLISTLPICIAPACAADRTVLEYNRDVRPILAENCFACHGPDSAARKADLRLDRRDEAIKAGAITAGDIEGSELLTRINAKDPN